MRTTLKIADNLIAQLKREAARQGRTMSELVETALRRYLGTSNRRGDLPPLPTFRGGESFVDIANRDALHRAMEER